MSGATDERAQAIAIADRFLDEPYADPDDDIRVLARQFNRSQERVERLRTACEAAIHLYDNGQVESNVVVLLRDALAKS